jgi:hypothetical protein
MIFVPVLLNNNRVGDMVVSESLRPVIESVRPFMLVEFAPAWLRRPDGSFDLKEISIVHHAATSREPKNDKEGNHHA